MCAVIGTPVLVGKGVWKAWSAYVEDKDEFHSISIERMKEGMKKKKERYAGYQVLCPDNDYWEAWETVLERSKQMTLEQLQRNIMVVHNHDELDELKKTELTYRATPPSSYLDYA